MKSSSFGEVACACEQLLFPLIGFQIIVRPLLADEVLLDCVKALGVSKRNSVEGGGYKHVDFGVQP
jgi:hypothetical protein